MSGGGLYQISSYTILNTLMLFVIQKLISTNLPVHV